LPLLFLLCLKKKGKFQIFKYAHQTSRIYRFVQPFSIITDAHRQSLNEAFPAGGNYTWHSRPLRRYLGIVCHKSLSTLRPFLSAQNLKQQYVICGDLGKSVNTRSLMGIFEIFLLLFLHIFNYGNTKDQTLVTEAALKTIRIR
jgi:hypothetical protein